MNGELQRAMIELSNNSPITNQLAARISEKLDEGMQKDIVLWLRHAGNEQRSKINIANNRRK